MYVPCRISKTSTLPLSSSQITVQGGLMNIFSCVFHYVAIAFKGFSFCARLLVSSINIDTLITSTVVVFGYDLHLP